MIKFILAIFHLKRKRKSYPLIFIPPIEIPIIPQRYRGYKGVNNAKSINNKLS